MENRVAVGPGPELLRRVLLGFVTALVVARPLVPGDDPGRTQLGTGVAGLGLVFLWLLAAAGWGVWRVWSRQGAWRGSLVEVGLLVLVGVSFFSADQPGRYWYPGWLISWEWVGVFAAFCLVRQLFRNQEENDGLLAAMMATGIAIGITASLQAMVHSPAGPEKLDPTVAWIFGVEVAAPAEPLGMSGLNARLDAWATTSSIIREHPWFGVGPGNFSREYPTFLTSAAQAKIVQPPSFLLEIAANYGLIGLAAVVATIALFFWRVIPAMRLKDKETRRQGNKELPKHTANREEDPSVSLSPCLPVSLSSLSPRFHWEFYLGGMAGLTLGFMLRFNPTGGWHALGVEASAALVRFVIWFGAFALLERVPWTNRARVAATSMGVAALLVYLLFNSGFGLPSLAVPFWVMAALALNATPSPLWPPRHWIGLILPAPLLAVVCLMFLAIVFYPVASAASSVNEARSRYPAWRDKLEPRWRQKLEKSTSAEERLVASQDADARLKKFILGPLESAREFDRANAAICTELAYWYAKEWQLYAALKDFENKRVQYLVRERQGKAGEQAAGAAGGGYQPGTGACGAQELDPKGPQGWWVLYLVRTEIAKGTDKPEERAKQYHMAANNVARLVELDPTEPRLRLLWADALLESRQKDDNVEAKKQFQEALRLDAEAGDGPRRLSEEQRAKIATWLGKTGG